MQSTYVKLKYRQAYINRMITLKWDPRRRSQGRSLVLVLVALSALTVSLSCALMSAGLSNSLLDHSEPIRPALVGLFAPKMAPAGSAAAGQNDGRGAGTQSIYDSALSGNLARNVVTLYDGTRQIQGVPVSKQERPLNCEFQSAADLATYYNHHLDWKQLFLKVGVDVNGDPERGFVGRSMDDLPGGLFPSGYGVYAPALARGFIELGIPATGVKGRGDQWLRNQIDQGRPVEVWATYDLSDQLVTGWTTRDGQKWIKAVRLEHTFIAIGYSHDRIILADPWVGQVRTYPWAQFMKSWNYLDQMALIIL